MSRKFRLMVDGLEDGTTDLDIDNDYFPGNDNSAGLSKRWKFSNIFGPILRTIRALPTGGDGDGLRWQSGAIVNDPFTRAVLVADVVYNDEDTLADTDLEVTVAAGGKYAIDLTVNSASAVKSLNMDFGGTATATNFIGTWMHSYFDDPASFGAAMYGSRVTSFGTDFGPGISDGLDGYYAFKGTIEVNAGGTFILRGAQNAADMSDTKILRGSTLILTKLN